ncbi:MAG TPA: VWA domain-containing protein [Bryobacteraceae bacterium]|nr:VWA domain-containing protein [Bryobacteraceae bacterium]
MFFDRLSHAFAVRRDGRFRLSAEAGARPLKFYAGALLRLFLALSAAAQQPEGPITTFKTTSNLVIINVFVRDKSGAAVEGLKKEDFKLLEDGKAQNIAVFEFQKLEEAPATAQQPAPGIAEAPKREAAKPAEFRPAPSIKPSKPGEVRYRDRRLIALLFDMSSMPQPDQIRAQEAAQKFLKTQMSPADVVSILTFSNSLKVEQDFTDDRDQLAKVIRSLRVGEGSTLAGDADTADADAGEDTQAAFTADETEFNIFNTDRKLSALESAAKMLGSLPERKALVYFSSGVGKTGTENESQLRSTVNAAVRANVAFYPVDARGLVALPPGGDATQGAPRGTGAFTGDAARKSRDKFNNQQETLTTLAADTGGKALLDDNELSLGIKQAQQDIRSYYILGYYSSNGALDGKFRKVGLSLVGTRSAGLKLDYRSGYFSAKDFKRFNADDKERQLEEALLLGDPITDLPLAIEVDYFRLTPERYFIPISVKIPGSEITVARKGPNETTEFDFIGQVRDTRSAIVANVRDGIKVKLTEENAAALGKKSIQYDSGFTLAPGKYQLKFLARENQTGKMGTFETTFVVPDLTLAQRGLPISSVVWSNQREPLSAAVGSASSQKKLTAIHPLVRDGQKLIPSVTRVFRKDQNLFVYFEVYDPATDASKKTSSVVATLSFYRGKAKISESEPIRVTQTPKNRPHMAPFQFQTALAKLNPGRYICQVNVVDELGRKFAFSRAPVVIVP